MSVLATMNPDNVKVSISMQKRNEQKSLITPKAVIDPADAANSLGTHKEDESAARSIVLRTYLRRWVVLAVVAMVNCLNTMTWIAFSPISNHVSAFYGLKEAPNIFSMLFIVVTIPVGIVAMWTGGEFGLRASILIAVWSNGIGTAIRLSSSYLPVEFLQFRFPVGITGQGVAALAYPFIMFLPTKVAAAWFPSTERTLATTIALMANPLGVLLANLISPMIVNTCEEIVTLNLALAIPSIFLCIFATFAINRSKPEVPPTLSASHRSYPFLRGIKECFCNKQYLVLLVVMGGGIGLFNTMYTLMQQLLCPSGYSNMDSGLTSALLITGGVVGSTAASLFVDRTKFYEETLKVAMALAVVFGLVFLQLTLHAGLKPWLLVACFIFGAFGLAAYPVGLQLSAECTFPVSETTSSGLVVLSGQIQSIIFLVTMRATAIKLQPERMQNQTCTLDKAVLVENLGIAAPTCGHDSGAGAQETVVPFDYTWAVITMSVIATLIVLLNFLAFRPKLKRLELETSGIRLMDTTVGKTASAEEEKELMDGSGGGNVASNSKQMEQQQFNLEEVKPPPEQQLEAEEATNKDKVPK